MASKNVFKKADLIADVQKALKGTRKEAKVAIEATLDAITKGLRKAEKVQITGFGGFTKRKIPAQAGGKLVKNPFTGQMVKSKPKPARTKIKFRPGPVLKNL